MCSIPPSRPEPARLCRVVLASHQALELVRGLGDLTLIGMDVVEVSPPYDHAEITALAAAHVAHDWLCLLARKAGSVGKPVGRL